MLAAGLRAGCTRLTQSWRTPACGHSRGCSTDTSAGMTCAESVAEGLGHQTVTRAARVRIPLRLAGLPVAVFLLLLVSASHCEPSTPTPAAAAICRPLRIRWFHARVRYYSNSDATFNPSRLILLAGDVETNPGPARDSGSGDVSVYYQNVRSLKNKLSVLRSEAPLLRKFDVVSLTETWLNPDVATSELELGLAGYTVFRRDRCGRIGGGVAVAVKTELMPRRRDDLEADCECLVVQIGVLRARNCLVATMYRPPDDPASLSEFYRCTQAIIATGLPSIFCGDFNLRYLKWTADAETGVVQRSFTQNCERRLCQEFLDNLELHGLRQLVTEPTGNLVHTSILFSQTFLAVQHCVTACSRPTTMR